MIVAVSTKAFSARLETRLANSPVGSVFDDLLAFLKELIPLITALPCLMAAKKNAKKLQANIDDEFRAGVKKKKGRTPARVRVLMKKHGCDDKDTQDDAWHEISAEAFADSTNVADTLIAAG